MDLLNNLLRPVSGLLPTRRDVANPPVLPATPEVARQLQVPSWESGFPAMPSWSGGRAIREAYESSHIVYTCVEEVATAAGSVPWHLEKRGEDDHAYEVVGDSDLEDLLTSPNEYMTGGELVERMAQHLLLNGNALLYKVRSVSRADRKPIELWPLMPDLIKPVKSSRTYLSHYEFCAGGQKFNLDPSDIIHVMLPDPCNQFWGLSPLRALGRVVDTEIDALNWWRMSIRNRAVKDGVLKSKELLDQDQYDLIQEQLMAQVMGPYSQRLPLVIGADFDWQATSSTPVEMDFLRLRSMTREEICAIYGVPPIILGILENSSYNNISTARLMFWLDTVLPFLERLRRVFDRTLLKDFIRPGQLRRYRTNFNVSGVAALAQAVVEKANAAETFFGMGVPFSQLNSRFQLGFTPWPDWDRSWMSSGLAPADVVASIPRGLPVGASAPFVETVDSSGAGGVEEAKLMSRGWL